VKLTLNENSIKPKIDKSNVINPINTINPNTTNNSLSSDIVSQPIVNNPYSNVTPMSIEEIVGKTMKSVIKAQNEENDELAALPSGARDFVKAAQGVELVKSLFKSPASTAVENTMGTVMEGILNNALANVTNPQHAPQQEPLLHKLATVIVHNTSQQLPQILDSLTTVLGKERLQNATDMGLQYVQQKQAQEQQQQQDWPTIVMQLDENNQEHVTHYAQHEGFTDIYRAQRALINHKILLSEEIEEYQQLQQSQVNKQIVEQPQQVERQQVEKQQVVSQQVVEQEVVEQEVDEYEEVTFDETIDDEINEISEELNKEIVDEEIVNKELVVEETENVLDKYNVNKSEDKSNELDENNEILNNENN